MKPIVLLTILMLLCFMATAQAEESGIDRIQPYGLTSLCPHDSAPCLGYLEAPLRPVHARDDCPRLLKYLSNIEFNTNILGCILQLRFHCTNPGIAPRINLFNRPIFLVLSFTN